MTKMMMKFGIGPKLPTGQGALPSSLQEGMGMPNNYSSQNPLGSIYQLATKLSEQESQGLSGYASKSSDSTSANATSTSTSIDTAFGSRTEKVLSNFLQNPVLKGEESEHKEAVCYGWNKFIYYLFACCITHFCLLQKGFPV